MALQASGAISLLNIQTEFGGANPISISEYYGEGGAPAGPLISMSDFYGLSAGPPPVNVTNAFGTYDITGTTGMLIYLMTEPNGYYDNDAVGGTVDSSLTYLSGGKYYFNTGLTNLTVSADLAARADWLGEVGYGDNPVFNAGSSFNLVLVTTAGSVIGTYSVGYGANTSGGNSGLPAPYMRIVYNNPNFIPVADCTLAIQCNLYCDDGNRVFGIPSDEVWSSYYLESENNLNLTLN